MACLGYFVVWDIVAFYLFWILIERGAVVEWL